jgi:glycosyltransferase involved in cell wall biosynthesis
MSQLPPVSTAAGHPRIEGGRRPDDAALIRDAGSGPLVSVITVVFNGASHLRRAIDSVLNQSYRPIEYIVVDGGSTDGTIDILRALDARIDYWISEPDTGIYDAMNKGIGYATGEIIGILNSDDWYEPDALKWSVEALQTSEAGYSYGSAYMVDATATRVGVARPVPVGQFARRVMSETPLPHPTMFVRRVAYDRCGGFDTGLKLAGDFELIARFQRQGVIGVEVPRTLVNFQLGGASDNPLVLRELRDVALRSGEPLLRVWGNYLAARATMAMKRLLPARAAGLLRGLKDSARRL